MTPISALVVDSGNLPAYSPIGTVAPISVDANGRLLVVSSGGGGGGVVTGNHTPSDAYANPTDAINSFSLLGGWNGATWDRLRSSTVADGNLQGIGLNVNALMCGVETGTSNVYRFTIQSFGSGTHVRSGLSMNTLTQPFYLDTPGNTMRTAFAHAANGSNLDASDYGLVTSAQAMCWDGTSAVRPVEGAVSGASLDISGNPFAPWSLSMPYGDLADGNVRRQSSDGAGCFHVVQADPVEDQNRPAAPSTYLHSAVADGAVIKAAPGRLLSIDVFYDPDDAPAYFQVFDKATAPAPGDTPILSFLLGTGAFPEHYPFGLRLARDWLGPSGVGGAVGISWGFSSTVLTYTAKGVTGEVNINATYA